MNTTPCREWQGSNNHGYGVRYEMKYGTRYVHRQVWIMAHGPIPPGKVIMHLCDNPACFLLEHLSLGTMADNNADKAAKGRARNGFAERTHCVNGHEFTPENTYSRPTGGRACRACNLMRKRHRKNVECQTCGGLGVGHPQGTQTERYWEPCPDCTPENVETPSD